MRLKYIIILIFILPALLFSAEVKNTQSLKVIQYTITNLSTTNLKEICKILNISDKGEREILIARILLKLGITNYKNIVKEEEEIPPSAIVIESAQEGEYIEISKNEKILTAKKNVVLKYKNILVNADEIKMNTKTKEILCEGNVIIKEGNRKIYGKKIFFNLKDKTGIIYDGTSESGGIIYRGKVIKKLSGKRYIITDGEFTTCSQKPPHFKITAKKLWVYPDSMIVMLSAYYIIADTKVFYLPVFVRFKKGTGIVTSWGKRRIEGWYAQNTYKTKVLKNGDLKIKFDHYQKRGEYAGIDFHYKTKEAEILTGIAGAYDKKLYGDSNINPETGEIEREYRGKVLFNTRVTFNQDKDNPAHNTTIRANFFRQSDYYFVYDFERYREERQAFHYLHYASFYHTYYAPTSHDWYIHITDVRKNSRLVVQTRWNFQWNNTLEEYKLNTALLPSIEYSLWGSIIPSTKERKGLDLNYNLNLKSTHTYYYDQYGNYLKAVNYRYGFVSLKRPVTLPFYVTFSFSGGAGLQEYKGYDITESEEENYKKLSYGFGQTDNSLQIGPSPFNLRLAHSLRFRFVEYSPEDEYGKIVSHTASISHYASFIKGIIFRASTSYNLRFKKTEKIRIIKDRFSDLNSYLTVSIIRNLYLSERYVYSIRKSRPLTSNFSLRYSISDFLIPYVFVKINSFSFSFLFNYDFTEPRNSRMNITTSFNFEPFKYWKVNVNLNSVNERVYLYSKELAEKYKYEGESGEYEYRNFLVDLLNSINIFQPEKMEDSYFKLHSASINATHDLHCWQLSFGYTLRQRFITYGRYLQYPYFEHQFWIKINLKYEPALKAEEEIRSQPPEIVK